ncbi:hypothetical protein [Photobacterium ganghwense]|uniref:hypothetical protein n=1 Tax=Photobacterium ganghwense TaxID=320778 RepID=UPI001A8ED383|nr:hypothetical protein [Photobacterium ganghwense]QSV17622.1 hypothetical protein FH974_25365 [Photobacterium ganghwense]
MNENTEKLLRYLAYSYSKKKYELHTTVILTNVVTFSADGFTIGCVTFVRPLCYLHEYVHGIDLFMSRFKNHLNRCGKRPVAYIDRGNFEIEFFRDGLAELHLAPKIHHELEQCANQLNERF